MDVSPNQICSGCGKAFAAEFAFCPYCGAPVGDAEGNRDASPRANYCVPGKKAQTGLSTRSSAALDAFEKEFAALKAKREAAPARRSGEVGGWYYIVFAVVTIAMLFLLFIGFRWMANTMRMNRQTATPYRDTLPGGK